MERGVFSCIVLPSLLRLSKLFPYFFQTIMYFPRLRAVSHFPIFKSEKVNSGQILDKHRDQNVIHDALRTYRHTTVMSEGRVERVLQIPLLSNLGKTKFT